MKSTVKLLNAARARVSEGNMKKPASKDTLLLRNRALQNAIKELVRIYIANPGTDGEFVTCIGSIHKNDTSVYSKRVRAAWDEARSLIQP